MAIQAFSSVSTGSHSFECGRDVGCQILKKAGTAPRAVLAYTTVYHDQSAFLQGLREAVGADPIMVGCSVQGLMSRGQLLEAAYVSGAMSFGGENVTASCALATEIILDPREKGRGLGRDLLAGCAQPRIVILHFDPLARADVDALLAGLREVVDCPIIGGGASQNWGPMVATFQFYGDRVLGKSAVALALGGDFTVITQASGGTIPIGITRTITKCDGIKILELDQRPAMDVWVELTGDGDPTQDHTSDLALGLRNDGAEEGEEPYRVLGPFGVSEEDSGVLLLAALPLGTELIFQHRTEQTVLEGSRRMAIRAREALAGRTLRAVIGFECGARTGPFLGHAAALEENKALQETIGPDAEWLGMLAWGEILPFKQGPVLFNYSYPLVCLAD